MIRKHLGWPWSGVAVGGLIGFGAAMFKTYTARPHNLQTATVTPSVKHGARTMDVAVEPNGGTVFPHIFSSWARRI